MSKIKYIAYLFVVVFLFSCEEEERSLLWGETKYYEDFIFHKYEPVRMTKSIQFDFNEDAERYAKDVEFGIYSKDSDGRFYPVGEDVALIYKDGELASGNKFRISPSEGSQGVELGIEFKPAAKEAMHTFYLKVLNNGSLDRINESETEVEALPIAIEWRAEKIDIMNPFKKWLLIGLAAFSAILIVIAIAIRLAISSFKSGTLVIVLNNTTQIYRLRGLSSIVGSSKSQKQGAWNKFTCGETKFMRDGEFFINGDIIITPSSRNRVRIGLPRNSEYFATNIILDKNETSSTITNSLGEKAQFTMQY